MTKVLSICAVLGLLLGGVVALLSSSGQRVDYPNINVREDSALEQLDLRPQPTEAVVAPFRDYDETVGAFSHRLAQFASVSALNDRESIEFQAQLALRAPLTPATVSHVQLLLGRLFEVEPEAAASFVRSADIPRAIASSIFRHWAEIDTDSAIALLDEIGTTLRQRQLAAAIIEVSGTEAIDRITSIAPGLGANSLAVIALVQLARVDPLSALTHASQLPSREAQAAALAEIGHMSAHLNVASTVSAAESIKDIYLRQGYVEAFHTQLALIDLGQFMEYLEGLEPGQQEVSLLERALAHAAEADPMGLLRFGRQTGGDLGVAAEAAALGVLSAEDPVDAIAHLESVPPGSRRDALVVSVASGYARRNFDAALAWATQIKPSPVRAKNAVLQVLAQQDLSRAVQIELRDPTTSSGRFADAPVVPAWFGSRMISDLYDPAGVADQIIASSEGPSWKGAMLAVTLSRWAVADLDSTIAWMQSRRGQIPVTALDAVMQQAAVDDVDRLISLVDVVVPELRAEWLVRVVGSAASRDPGLALAIAERYRAEPYYDSLFTGVIRGIVAEEGPQEATRWLGRNPPPLALVAVGQTWAKFDPAGAFSWAAALPDGQARGRAISEILGTWSDSDGDAAMDQARRLTDGALRQQVMDRICRRSPESRSCGK